MHIPFHWTDNKAQLFLLLTTSTYAPGVTHSRRIDCIITQSIAADCTIVPHTCIPHPNIPISSLPSSFNLTNLAPAATSSYPAQGPTAYHASANAATAGRGRPLPSAQLLRLPSPHRPPATPPWLSSVPPTRLPSSSHPSAISTSLRQQIISGYSSSFIDSTLESMFLLAFFSFLRCSEFTSATSKTLPNQLNYLLCLIPTPAKPT
ncbi:uncharacterized protein LOC119007719 isoform X1 [Acanthopagrus latus]|uniref:uncharacterized protein LOC119007719 isoform X1 n=1 Tax=Acanthopagrus latus TaxID=8177 RepID=UPI00187C1345|nr:uncharacterized protein LOC119007719 isoform X1 [Acanthopagrus latus]